MKILMIPSGYYPECCGGVEVITQALSEGLVKRGHEVFVLCQSNETSYTVINGVKVYKLKPKEIPNPKNNRLRYKMNRLLQMYNPFNKKDIRKIIREINPDMVNLHMARTLSMSVLEVVQEFKIPVVSTLHEYFSLWNFDPFDKMEKMLETKPQWYVELIRNKHRKLTKKVEYLTAPLQTTIDIYQKEGYYKGVQGEEILNSLPMMDDGIRKDILENKLKQLNKNKKINFLIISRLMPFKGIEVALEGFMKTTNKNIVLNVVGDGPLANYVKECAKKDNRIKYHGYLIGKEKDKIFKKCNVLVFPTTELETFGLVILEAYDYSMPVMASLVEATKRLINNEVTGVLIENVTADKLSENFEKYANKDLLIEQMNNCYREINSENHERFINNYERVYMKVLEERRDESK